MLDLFPYSCKMQCNGSLEQETEHFGFHWNIPKETTQCSYCSRFKYLPFMFLASWDSGWCRRNIFLFSLFPFIYRSNFGELHGICLCWGIGMVLNNSAGKFYMLVKLYHLMFAKYCKFLNNGDKVREQHCKMLFSLFQWTYAQHSWTILKYIAA